MILPFAKLGTLALKTICKPIAKRIKKEAGHYPQFRYAIINFAQVTISPIYLQLIYCQLRSYCVIDPVLCSCNWVFMLPILLNVLSLFMMPTLLVKLEL
ncbi:hypothetical protein HanHA300_Chr17g0671391 [Helianthus annuus]|nr:hypothetical protein HanHA300_Chr17g0671391 [Helianthus annuus]KAJ0633962.1 hypothetical protein HanLR1_Chr17g0682721 [Helianthus annuus]